MLRRDEVQVGALLRYQEGAGAPGWWRVVELDDQRVTLERADGGRGRKTLKRSTVAGRNWTATEVWAWIHEQDVGR